MRRRIQGQWFPYQHIHAVGSPGENAVSLKCRIYFLVSHVGIVIPVILCNMGSILASVPH
jgi:hypothetical protein